GTSQKDTRADANGGLLRSIGEFGILLLKDFTSVLSMHRDSRAAVLAALREIYDGNWQRHVGVDGGRTLSWSGKLGMLAGCTPIIDTHHAVIAAMGERFTLYRLAPIDGNKQAEAALANVGQERQMRRELADAAVALFQGVKIQERPISPLSASDQ